MSEKTFKIQIKGRVQGVGFRPFVFNLAKQLKITGTVSNDAEGVIIRMTSSREKANSFLDVLLQNPPPVSIIKNYLLEESTSEIFEDFKIVPSILNQNINIPLTPDFTICNHCKEEVKDVKNRRYNYPFTTCVNCGPRYAITTKFPFERAHTALTDFEMCPACEKEYKDPTNRRFHSQTNSCSDCGVQLELVDNEGNIVAIDQQKIIKEVATYISKGKIIAIKNANGYLLCCDATNSEVVEKLRSKKKRPNKPFAVLYDTIESIQNDFRITEQEKESLTNTVAPIVILKNTESTRIGTQVIAPGLNQTGVLLPTSSLLVLLMDNLKAPIVCTS